MMGTEWQGLLHSARIIGSSFGWCFLSPFEDDVKMQAKTRIILCHRLQKIVEITVQRCLQGFLFVSKSVQGKEWKGNGNREATPNCLWNFEKLTPPSRPATHICPGTKYPTRIVSLANASKPGKYRIGIAEMVPFRPPYVMERGVCQHQPLRSTCILVRLKATSTANSPWRRLHTAALPLCRHLCLPFSLSHLSAWRAQRLPSSSSLLGDRQCSSLEQQNRLFTRCPTLGECQGRFPFQRSFF